MNIQQIARMAGNRIKAPFSLLLFSTFILGSSTLNAGVPDMIFADGNESTVLLVATVDYPAPLIGALVEARVAGRIFTTTADGAGNFALRITPLDENTPVLITAKGSGAQSHIRYASILDRIPILMTQAGTDGRLEVAENPYVKPSPFTSGLVIALQAAQPALFAGNMPLARPDPRIWSDADLALRMPLLTALARGDVSLPVGATDSLDAVQNETMALSAWNASAGLREQACPSVWCSILDDLASNAAIVPLLPPPSGVAIPYTLYRPVATSFAKESIRLDGAGSGEFAGEDTFSINWTAVGNKFRMERPAQAPFLLTTSFVLPPGGVSQIEQTTAQVAQTVRYARGPLGGTMLAQGTVTRVSYPTRPDLGITETESEPRAFRPANIDQTANVGFVLPSTGSQNWVLPTCTSGCDSLAKLRAEPHRFDAAGTGLAERLNLAFTWVAGPPTSGGQPAYVDLSYADGLQTRVALLADASGYRAATTKVLSGATKLPRFGSGALPYDASLRFETVDLVGQFRTLINCDAPFSSLNTGSCSPPTGFTGFNFLAGGTGTAFGGLSGTFQWSVAADGRLTIIRSTGERRYWQLVARISGSPARFIVLENVEASAVPPPFSSTSRLVPYERAD